jgi:hypothetical protein
MSNPSQPSFVWQIYCHDLEPNASLFGTEKACEPIHIQMNQTDWHLVVVNSTPVPVSGATAKVSVYNLDGTLGYTNSQPVKAAPDVATDLGEIAFPTAISTVHFVKLDLADSKGKVISTNFYWRTSATPAPLPTFGFRRPAGAAPPAAGAAGAPPVPFVPTPEQIAAYRALQNAPPTPEAIWESAGDDFSALNDLPTVALNIQAQRHDTRDGNVELTVTVSNTTKSIALMAHLQLRKATSGDRVLPVFYSDNYISLVPGESRTITITAAKSDLGGEAPQIAVDGWNVTAAPTASDVAIVPNTEAIVHQTLAVDATQTFGVPVATQ